MSAETKAHIDALDRASAADHCGGGVMVLQPVFVFTGTRKRMTGTYLEEAELCIRRELTSMPRSALVVQGGATGIDTLVRHLAERQGLQSVTFHANWDYYGRPAGMLRNNQMLNLNPRLVIGIHHDYENSKGTKACIEEARRRGLSWKLYDLKGESK